MANAEVIFRPFLTILVGVLVVLPDAAAAADPERPPWQAALDADAEVPRFADICFDDFEARREMPQPDELKKWFLPVPGQRFEVKPTQVERWTCGEFDGLARLAMPWRADVALRLSLQRFAHLRIHCYHGTAGVTLAYYPEEQDGWAAYLTTRVPGAVPPESLVLAATDEGRARRTEIRTRGTFDLRWHAGELVLTRGDIVLLRAPCEPMPDEVYLEGKAAFRGIAAVRSQPPPTLLAAAPPPTADAGPAAKVPQPALPATPPEFRRPAELEWKPTLGPGAQFAKTPDGAVVLTADKAERSGYVVTPLPTTGAVWEVVLEIEQATPGTGVFLGRAEGAPAEVIRFVRDRRTGKTCLTTREDDTFELDVPAATGRIVAYAAPRQWLRLLYGCGAVRWWISTDGVHWAWPEAPWGSRPINVTAVGLHHVPKKEGCQIKARQIAVRELPHLAALMPAAVRDRAKAVIDAAHIGIWLTRITESQPADVDLADWRRACALRTLGAGCARDLANALIEILVNEAARLGKTLEQRRDLLGEVALLLDTRDDGQNADKHFARYQVLALDAFAQRGERPFSWIRPAAMSVPLATVHPLRIARDDLLRLELLQLAGQQRWPELSAFCRQLRYFKFHETAPLYRWAEMTAVRQDARRASGAATVGLHDEWRHPLIVDVSREAYNVVAELKAALEGGSLNDAVRFIAGIEPGAFPGLTPALDDPAVFVSVNTAVHDTLDARPDVAARLREQYGRGALLRVQRAVRENDAALLELATVQYAGSEAAAEAHRWLGDRALSSGWFYAALVQYRQAARSASAGTKRELTPRVRLAAAMLGRPVGNPETAEVRLGAQALRPDEFESLLAELLKRPSADPSASLLLDATPVPAPKPTAWAVPRRLPVDGAVGREPNVELIPNARRFNVDWVGRQLATVLEGGTLFVSNRFQVAAYDLASGQRKWQGQLPQDTIQRAQEWGLSRMQPLVTLQRVYARLLYQQTPQMVCLDKRNGEVLWTAETPANREFVSDPVMVQGQLLALTLTQVETDELHLHLAVLDAENGRVLQQYPLLRMNDVWRKRRYCEVTPINDGLLVALGGITLGCDLDGNVRWLRRHTVLPPAEEPQWVQQDFERPLLAGNAVYIAQPGLRSVERLEADTGHQTWLAILPTVQRLVGLSGGRVIVQTEEGLLALDADKGQPVWTHAATDLLTAALCADDGILYARRAALEDGKPGFCPRLVWLDPATGTPRAVARLTGLEDPDPRLGPLVVYQDRIWTFFGRGHDQATRELLELMPQGPAQKPELEVRSTDPWAAHLPARLVSAMMQRTGPWRLLCGEAVGPQSVEAERWGRREVPGTRCRANLPIVLARKIAVPADGQTKLRLTVASEPAQEWQLQVRLAGQAVSSQDVTAAAQPQPWKTLEIDLTPQAGRNGWLIVEAHFLRGGDHADLYWDSVELVTR